MRLKTRSPFGLLSLDLIDLGSFGIQLLAINGDVRLYIVVINLALNSGAVSKGQIIRIVGNYIGQRLALTLCRVAAVYLITICVVGKIPLKHDTVRGSLSVGDNRLGRAYLYSYRTGLCRVGLSGNGDLCSSCGYCGNCAVFVNHCNVLVGGGVQQGLIVAVCRIDLCCDGECAVDIHCLGLCRLNGEAGYRSSYCNGALSGKSVIGLDGDNCGAILYSLYRTCVGYCCNRGIGAAPCNVLVGSVVRSYCRCELCSGIRLEGDIGLVKRYACSLYELLAQTVSDNGFRLGLQTALAVAALTVCIVAPAVESAVVGNIACKFAAETCRSNISVGDSREGISGLGRTIAELTA